MKKLLLYLSLSVPAILAIAPLVFLAGGTFMGSTEIKEYLAPVLLGGDGFAVWRLFPAFPTLKGVVELLFDSPEFFTMFWNTIKITLGVLAGQLLFGVPAAWGLARYDFVGKKLIYRIYIVLMMMPFQVTMLSEYLLLKDANLLDTLWAVILPAMFGTFPVFLMYRFFCDIPQQLFEAARMDGAGELQIFFSIGLPVASSGIIAAMLLQILTCQSMLEEPLTFLETPAKYPLSLYLPEIDLSQAGFAICASFVAMLPAVLLFLIGQDYLEAGIVTAAVKE